MAIYPGWFDRSPRGQYLLDPADPGPTGIEF
jgi:hypothetical protein